jgi:LacI family transcriptional regulator
MAAPKRLTIRDIAAAAGVSTQTVSRVLNNRPDVAPETLERIQRVIEETGYSPNMLARSLTQGRSHTIGVVAYGLDYFGPSHVVTAIERQAAEMGYGISLSLILEPATDDVDHVLSDLLARRVDGIIWAIPEVGDNRSWLNHRSSALPVPMMLVGGMAGRTCIPYVGIDNLAIGRLATEHLLAGGSRRVGVVTGPLSWWEAQQRLRGWRETLESHGLEASDRLVVSGDWTANSGQEAFDRLLEQCPDIDAVFASNDQMALGLLHAAFRIGRRVPEELSIAGVDNIPESAHFCPPLTTVHQPLAEVGAMAMREIDRAIAQNRPARQSRPGGRLPEPANRMTLLEPELIIRASSRPVSPPSLPASVREAQPA